jgi:glycosyltransferase involved in cell wall biosynthesis
MNLLILTTLYPNNVQHRHGVFIENRTRELIKNHPSIKVKVLAPVPYFPSWLPLKDYKPYSHVFEKEVRHTIEVVHPKYWVIPKIGMNINPYFLYQTCVRAIKLIQEAGFVIDVIDAHYFYPDGVVANWLGKKFNIPVMVTARGSDINIIPNNKIAKKRIIKALEDVQASAAVSQALADKMIKLAPKAKPPVVLRNGVDLTLFSPTAVKPELPFLSGGSDKLILSVGNLIELKGHHLVIDALSLLNNSKLIIIGDGEEKNKLKEQVSTLGLEGRVFFMGNLPQSELPGYYVIADVLVLASSREGMPNVLLESLACGTPVIATDVGGCAEVISDNDIGELLAERKVSNIVEALKSRFEKIYSKEVFARFSSQLSWRGITQQQCKILSQLAEINNKESH